MSNKPLRDSMPQITEFIDALREAFGADVVNGSIRKGVSGVPGYFHATENGHEVGTPFNDSAVRRISLSDVVLDSGKKPLKGCAK